MEGRHRPEHDSASRDPLAGERYIATYLAAVRARTVIDGPAECAWVMLLDLYSHRHRKYLSVSDLCTGSMHPATTALRWLNVLLADGLIERRNDEHDRRRVYILLTDTGTALIERWIATIEEVMRSITRSVEEEH